MKRGQIPSVGELTAFVSAARHGSFTRAAGELNLTQGAVSRQIRLLESRLGIALFERVRQRIVLTDAGKLYLSHVEKALNELIVATRRVTTLSDSMILNLAVLPTVATRWLIPRLPDFHIRNQGVTIHLTTLQRPVDFAIEPFDAAIFHGAESWPGTIAHHLMDVEVVPVCSPRLKAEWHINSADQIPTYPVLHEINQAGRWQQWMAAAGVKLDRPLKGDSYSQFSMIVHAAVAGLGIALLPVFMIEEELRTGKLEIILDKFLKTKTSYFLFVPEARASSPAVRQFTVWLIEQARLHLAGPNSAKCS